MGITILSTATPSTASAGMSAGPNGTSAPATGFAALLTGQLNLTPQGEGMALLQEAKGGAADEKEALSGTDGLLAGTDPALAAMLGLPANLTVPAPPVRTTLQPDLDLAQASTEATEQLGLSSSSPQVKTALLAETFTLFSGPSDTSTLQEGNSTGQAANLAVNNFTDTLNQATQSAALHVTSNRPPAPPPPSATVSTPLHSPDWGKGFSEQVVWLARGEQQSAQININPPQLGPVQISLQINGDQANAVFASPHPEVRQAIEASLSQLREMLSSAGINLGQADIGANLAQQQQNARTPFQPPRSNTQSGEMALTAENSTIPGGVSSSTISLQRGRGMVDLFA